MFHWFGVVTNTRGDALPGWQVGLVQVGTETVVPIFSDENSTPIINVSGVANRAVADDNGNYDFFVPSGTYTLQFYNPSGVFQRQQRFVAMFGADAANTANLASNAAGKGASLVATEGSGTVQTALNARPTSAALAASGGAALVGVIQSGTGATARTVQDKLRETVSVKDFGAVGDGVANDTAAIQAAIDATPAGETLLFNPGNYRLTAELTIPRPMRLMATSGGAQLSMATTNTNHIRIGDGTLATRNSRLGVTIEGLTFAPASGVTAFTSGACIRVQYGAFVTIEKCDFFGADGGGKKLWNGIELDRCEDSWIRDCRGRQLRNSALFTYGASGIANRTVDIIIDRFRTADNDGDHVYFGPHSQGIFLTDWVGISVAASKSGLRIDADPATEQGTNYFIVNPNIEGGNNANSNGIYVEDGQGVDIQGGWAGGFEPTTCNGVWFGAEASSCMVNGMRFETARIDGPACSLNGCEITGALNVTTNAVSIGSAAQGFSIVGGRIRQATTAGIAISGTPADGVISGVTFANIADDNYISGAAYAGGPIVSSIRGQATRNITAAATTTVRYGVPLYQITGATAIGGFTLLAPGTELNVQAGSGGITINNSVNVVLKSGSSLSLAAFTLRKFVCDGSNWFEV